MMPAQLPHRSKQDYGTPPELLAAVQRRLGRIVWDLAADRDNAVCPEWYGPESPHGGDSLAFSWRQLDGLLWLNPPFENIEPWAWKCSVESHYGSRIALLTPASVGSDWYRRHVHGQARVLFLSPRLTFVGCKDPYPKDCMLSVYGPNITPGWEVWRWKELSSGSPGHWSEQ